MRHSYRRRCSLIVLMLLTACGATQQGAQTSQTATAALTAAPETTSVASDVTSAPSEAPAVSTTAVVASTAVATSASTATTAETMTETAPGTTETATAGSAQATITPGPGEFANPVIDQDFADPDVLKVGDTYYAYATNAGTSNIQAAKSTDLVQWTMLSDALPVIPLWTRPGLFFWAPEVTTSADGKTYLMYFTARDDAADKQCIGVATSDKPEGPFTSASDKAFICQPDEGGSIDASSFVDDDGSRYVLWKNDGNCCGFETYLYIQKVSPDGLTLEGEPTRLIEADQAWEGPLIEAPTLWKNGGKYYLFYSANYYKGVDYATGYAVADSVLGPYTKAAGPLLVTDMQGGAAIGPGGQDIVVDKDGDTWMLYHSWEGTLTYRRMQIDELVWEGDTPVVQGPDKEPQPVP